MPRGTCREARTQGASISSHIGATENAASQCVMRGRHPEPSSGQAPRVRLWLERSGSGYALRDAATYEVVREDDPRIRVVSVAGVSYRTDELQDEGFTPGRRLTLVPEPQNEHDPHAIGIWDAVQRLQVGYVPADVARGLSAAEWQAVALRDFVEGERRLGLRVLLAPRDAWIGSPRS
jgi:HIRAN domain-containing protein